MKIIYCYEDKWTDDKIVYVGKDSHGDKQKRHKAHLSSTRPTKFERILQSNPIRYRYKVLFQVIDEEWYDDIEGIMIWVLKKFGAAELNLAEELDRNLMGVLNDTTTER